ncbi:hypothetical protein IEO21_05311 [Rhodonia placenta]|uniref:F-box domain-containing protein n=1 Tax=Rhodonia placenta TaxID=104341 RepID=A0A8H7P2F5_9APHY|nr:hypothetical protein IEO21_05311 [Postia placenta]
MKQHWRIIQGTLQKLYTRGWEDLVERLAIPFATPAPDSVLNEHQPFERTAELGRLDLPAELLIEIFGNLDDISDALFLTLTNMHLWAIGHERIYEILCSSMGTWAGHRIMCIDDYTKFDDMPEGVLSEEEPGVLKELAWQIEQRPASSRSNHSEDGCDVEDEDSSNELEREHVFDELGLGDDHNASEDIPISGEISSEPELAAPEDDVRIESAHSEDGGELQSTELVGDDWDISLPDVVDRVFTDSNPDTVVYIERILDRLLEVDIPPAEERRCRLVAQECPNWTEGPETDRHKWALCNFSKHEYVRADATAALNDQSNMGPFIEADPGLGGVLLSLKYWSSDISTATDGQADLHRGPWAGDRLAITALPMESEEWKDITNPVLRQLAAIHNADDPDEDDRPDNYVGIFYGRPVYYGDDLELALRRVYAYALLMWGWLQTSCAGSRRDHMRWLAYNFQRVHPVEYLVRTFALATPVLPV